LNTTLNQPLGECGRGMRFIAGPPSRLEHVSLRLCQAPVRGTTAGMSIERAAELLLEARRARRPRGPLPHQGPPADLAAASAVQDRFVAGQGRPVGWKIGYTNPVLQRALGIRSPVFGRLLEDRIWASGAALPAADFAIRVIETEVGVRMARALPPRAEPWSPEEVADAVECLFPSFELVDSRFVDWRKLTPLEAVAGNGLHSGWGHGPARPGLPPPHPPPRR